MQPAATSAPVHRTGRERRRLQRYQVDLPGQLQADGFALAVTVSDLSASGALVAAEPWDERIAIGQTVTLVVEEFGPIRARIVHVALAFCGLQFLEAHLLRDRLTRWLREEVGAS